MIIRFILIAGLLFWVLAYPVADYYGRRFSRQVIRRGDNPHKVALTFDDGPDPRYTPRILDILKASGAHATFFLVGQRAVSHPDLVRRMLDEGHEVAAHSEHHRHAYTLLFSTGREINWVKRDLQHITGNLPRWYRPPWGAFNFLVLPVIKKAGMTPVLWSVNADDWSYSTGVAGIRQRLNQRMHPGAVIVLHDAGGDDGAPENTIAALKPWLEDLKAAGIRAVTLSELID